MFKIFVLLNLILIEDIRNAIIMADREQHIFEDELMSRCEPEKNTLHNIEDFFYYFAFGSNLLKERLNVQVKKAVFEGIGILKDFELTFFDNGTLWMGATASIEPKVGSYVWGCVWRVPHSFAEELDLQESGYHRLTVPIFKNNNSTEVKWFCRTYQYSNPLRIQLPPSPHYKHVIVSGAIENNLPEEYIERLKEISHNNYQGRVELNLNVLKELNSK